MNVHEVDVAVVGAGPAGSTAAVLLARRGYSVALIDRRRFPRDKACGDLLVGSTVKRLERLGLDDSFEGGVEVATTRWVGADGATLQRKIPTSNRSVAVPRAQFDAGLCRVAEQAGASLHHGSAHLAQSARDRPQRLLVHPDDGPDYAVQATLILAADGSTSAITKAAGAAPIDRSRSALAMRVYLPTSAPTSTMTLYEIEDGAALAYGWAFPSPDSMLNVGICSYGTDAGDGLRERLDRLVRRVSDEFDLNPESAGRSSAGLIRFDFAPEQCAFGPVLGIGDAVGLANPTNGEGISFAIGSAEIAADTAHRSLAGDEEATYSYGRSLRDEFGPMLSQGLAWLDEGLIEANAMFAAPGRTQSHHLIAPRAQPAVEFSTEAGSVLWPQSAGSPVLLTALGVTLWKHCSGSVSLGQLAQDLAELDGLAPADWPSAVQQFVHTLDHHRLVGKVERGMGPGSDAAQLHPALAFANYQPAQATQPRRTRASSLGGPILSLAMDGKRQVVIEFGDDVDVPPSLKRSRRVNHDADRRPDQPALTVVRTDTEARTIQITGPATTVFVGDAHHEVLWGIIAALLPALAPDTAPIEATVIAADGSALIMPLQAHLLTCEETRSFANHRLRRVIGQVVCDGTSVVLPSPDGVDAWLDGCPADASRPLDRLALNVPLLAVGVDVERGREVVTSIVLASGENGDRWVPVTGPELSTWSPSELAEQVAGMLVAS